MTSPDLDETLEERGARYGRFIDHAEATQAIKQAIFSRRARETLPSDAIEALDMIAHKLGRIVCGDADYADTWHDIAGYAKLVEDRINGVVR